MAGITLRSDRLPPTPRRTRLTKEREAFCQLVAGGRMRATDAFRRTWPDKARKLTLSRGSVLKATNELMRNQAVLNRIAELVMAKMSR